MNAKANATANASLVQSVAMVAVAAAVADGQMAKKLFAISYNWFEF